MTVVVACGSTVLGLHLVQGFLRIYISILNYKPCVINVVWVLEEVYHLYNNHFKLYHKVGSH